MFFEAPFMASLRMQVVISPTEERRQTGVRLSLARPASSRRSSAGVDPEPVTGGGFGRSVATDSWKGCLV